MKQVANNMLAPHKSGALACLLISTALTNCSTPIKQVDRHTDNLSNIQAGKQISFQRNKGNCLACHAIEDGEDPGNVGPALANIQARFKSKAQLKAVIADATQFNAQTSMPPFGKNKILTPQELDLVVDYIWSLN
ncbi:MAG: sulfur-oxidizing protein SoxX [Methyloprofundus sp.]|nr:MAG: sulfur-oxidizing protein SoxX [Methyloprofundus sp.]